VWCCILTEPMEEDILQVVKYCTELVDDKDLEKLDLVIKYMKRYCSEFSVTGSCHKYSFKSPIRFYCILQNVPTTLEMGLEIDWTF